MRMIRHPWPSGIGLLAAALVCSGVSTSSLSFSTFLGGSNFDQVYALAVDAAGNVYVTGQTASANFPTRTGGLDGNRDVFVAKLILRS
jgi:Beta-propeller repeat